MQSETTYFQIDDQEASDQLDRLNSAGDFLTLKTRTPLYSLSHKPVLAAEIQIPLTESTALHSRPPLG